MKKASLFNLTMMVIGSMIGAGLLVVPNSMMSYGVSGTLGWILAAICSFILARIFADITVSLSSAGGLTNIIAHEYGQQSGFVAGFNYYGYLIIGSSFILFAFIDYLFDFLSISGSSVQFIVAMTTVVGLNVMHVFSDSGFKLLSGITILKILLFGSCAMLGITEFNLFHVLGVKFSGSVLDLAGAVVAKNNGLITIMMNTLKASSVALFAFAGMEGAASSPDLVKDPNRTIPRAIMIGIAVCSFIYLLTHICVVNALGGGIYSDTPVKTAMVMLIEGRYGNFLSTSIGMFVSIVAVLGCAGTLLVLLFIAPNILYSMLKIVDPDFSSRRSKTGLPVYLSFVSTGLIVLMAFLKYIMYVDLSLLRETVSFLLLYFYLECVFVHFKALNDRLLTVLGFLACAVLLMGCTMKAVFVGTVLQILAKIIFGCFAKRALRRKSVVAQLEETPVVD